MSEKSPERDTNAESGSTLSELLAGAVSAAAGAGMWIGTASLTPTIPGTLIGPALLPRICAVGFFVLGLLLLANSTRHLLAHANASRSTTGSLRTEIAGFSVPVLLVAMWLLAPTIGFLATTALAGFTLMRLRGGPWIGSAVCALLIVVAVHFLFTDVMRIQMPQGMIY